MTAYVTNTGQLDNDETTAERNSEESQNDVYLNANFDLHLTKLKKATLIANDVAVT